MGEDKSKMMPPPDGYETSQAPLTSMNPPIGGPPDGFEGGSQPQMGGKPPIGAVANLAMNLAPWNRVSNAMPQIAGSMAEKLGGMGLPPQVSAALSLPVAMAPQLISGAAGIAQAPETAESLQISWQKIQDILNSGSRIGEAEKAAGVITRPPDKLPTSGNVGEVLNTLEGQLDAALEKGKALSQQPEQFAEDLRRAWGRMATEQSGTEATEIGHYVKPDTFAPTAGSIDDPQTAKDAYAIANYVRSNPNLVGKSNEINVTAQRVGNKASQLLNQLVDKTNASQIASGEVPSRVDAAADYAKLKYIPNIIKSIASIPAQHPASTMAYSALAGTLGWLGKLIFGEGSRP